MRLVTINNKCLKAYIKDPEMLQKSKRPCALIVKLKYKGKRYDFAIPLRSNINPSAPKEQFFPLPPRKTTKEKYRHGVHYIKMFPVKSDFLIRFRTEGNAFATLTKQILDHNEKTIVKQCQAYLEKYEKGIRPAYSTDIDYLIKCMEEI